jgi:hypothetical protein
VGKKSAALLAICVAALVAQEARPMLPACGLGGNQDHPCHCMRHTEEVQNAAMRDCLGEALKDPKAEYGNALKACAPQIPDHCSIVERYGNWSTDENGEHDKPMQNQCRRACTRSHCKCDDGPTCHFAHTLEEDR